VIVEVSADNNISAARQWLTYGLVSFSSIKIGEPIVIFLNFFRSADKCQGILLFRPITRLLAIATISDIFIFLKGVF